MDTPFTRRPSYTTRTEEPVASPEDELFMMKVLASRMDPEDRYSEQNTRAIMNATLEAEAARELAPLPPSPHSTSRGGGGGNSRRESWQSDGSGRMMGNSHRSMHSDGSGRLSSHSHRGSIHSAPSFRSSYGRGTNSNGIRRQSLQSQGSSRRNSYHHQDNSSRPGGGIFRRQSTREDIARGNHHLHHIMPLYDDDIQEEPENYLRDATSERSEDPVILKVLEERNRQLNKSNHAVRDSSARVTNPQYTPRVPSTAYDDPPMIPGSSHTSNSVPPHPASMGRDYNNYQYASSSLAYDSQPSAQTLPSLDADYHLPYDRPGSNPTPHARTPAAPSTTHRRHDTSTSNNHTAPAPGNNEIDGATCNSNEIDDMDAKIQRNYRTVFRESQASTPGAYASAPALGISDSTNTNTTNNNNHNADVGENPMDCMTNDIENASPTRGGCVAGDNNNNSVCEMFGGGRRGTNGSSPSSTAGDRGTMMTAEVHTSQSTLRTSDLMDGASIGSKSSTGKRQGCCRTGLLGVIVGVVLVAVIVGVVLGLVVLPSKGVDGSIGPLMSPEESMAIFHDSLPASTQQALLDPSSSQSMVYGFVTSTLINDESFTSLPLWKQQQRIALAMVYYELNGEMPPKEKDECRWLKTAGACNITSRQYQKLKFEMYEDTNMIGMPLEVCLLTNLEELTIEGSSTTNLTLVDLVPEEVVKSTPQLQTLQLTSLQLSGSIPSYLGEWTSLSTIDLKENQLTGTIPDVAVKGWSHLQYWHMEANQLSGLIPTEVGLLSELAFFDCEENWLTGSIPSEFGQLYELGGLHLRNNQLSGDIPSELGNLNLDTLYTKSNKNITGMVPPELCNIKTFFFQVDCDTAICCGENAGGACVDC